MKKINIDKFLKILPIITVLLIVSITIGFASFTSSSSIVANANVDPYIGIQILKFTESSAQNNGASNYETHTIDEVTTGAYLPNSNSEITYKIDLVNLGTFENGIYTVTGLPNNLEYNFSNYTEGDKICDETSPNNCSKLAKKSIYMTIRYKRDSNGNITGYNSSTTTYPLDLTFDFRTFHSITYSGFTGTYRNYIIDGGSLNITFNQNDTPDDITVTGATKDSYTNSVLSISGATNDVTITAVNQTVTEKAYIKIQNIYNNSTPSEDSSCENTILPDDTSDNNLRFVGSKPCNYIYFNNSNWRIIGLFKINNNTLIKIVNPTAYSTSDKYHSSNASGYQTWGKNSLSTTLNGTFYQTLTTNGYSQYIESVPWNIGAPASNANKPSAFYAAEIATKTSTSYNVGLLNISDIAYATSGPTNGNRNTCLNANMNTWNSSSVGCISSSDIVNDWLYLGNNEWTIDAINNQARVYRMQSNGIPYVQSLNASSTHTRTVVYLKENITFESGNGSNNSPYIIKALP